jgi:hypothetical protein
MGTAPFASAADERQRGGRVSPTTHPRTRPTDYTLLLPPGWARLPTGPDAPAAVTRLVNRRFQSVQADKRELLRRRVRREILSMLDRAQAAGGIEVHMLVDPVRGQAVSAACLASYVTSASPGRQLTAADLLPEIEGAGATVSLATVGGGDAVRRFYVTEASPEPAGMDPATAINDVESMHAALPRATHVDYVVPVPGSDGHLLLSFSTATGEVADELVQLFDAMATTLRWVWSA